MPDYYEVLQVHPRAEPEVIRAAYRILARKYHPDHGGDASRMIALNDAWDVLGDPAMRAAYDAARVEATAEPTPAAPSQPGSGTQPAPEASYRGAPPEASHASPPPGHPSGTVLNFGRYSGWSLGEIARHDLDYLEWLQRSTVGRGLRSEIDTILKLRRPREAGASRDWRGHPRG
jgi:curved DNA-binding protein CbpA